MTENPSDEIRLAFNQYLDLYFTRRDLQSTLTMLSPTISGFGTGMDEKGFDLEDFKRLYARDLAEAPNPIHYQISKLHISTPAHGLGIVSCILNIQTQILDQKLSFNHLRLSMVFAHHQGAGWLVELMNISLPTELHAKDESYPIKELEAQKITLQRLVEEKTRALNDALHKISMLAATDKLTSLFNRLKLDEYLDNELQRSQRYGNPLSIIMADLDDFKAINDQYGHLAGDQVLVDLAVLVSTCVRQTEFVGRWGGEEFLIICTETTALQAVELAERIRAAVEAHEFLGEHRRHVTASFGIASFRSGDSREEMIDRADAALYLSKKNGKNRVTPG